ncbi:Hypothetical protein NTJ_01595 [Nesidiocoris tenuis]|uniref:Inner centromere protein ARK-binding domain-containing protein n=1 Tax=Nesidiocoris tenuis TaxID=355587 RepID=A0ABN7A9W5_9HEMI|nr:Hypothetical protein NTJ_01595 [Nesidiocoris tenuis]
MLSLILGQGLEKVYVSLFRGPLLDSNVMKTDSSFVVAWSTMLDQSLLDDLTALEGADFAESYHQYGLELLASFKKVASQMARNANKGKPQTTDAQSIKFPPSVSEKLTERLQGPMAHTLPPNVSPTRADVPLLNMTTSPTTSSAGGRPPRRAKQRVHSYALMKISAKVRRPTNADIHESVSTLVHISEDSSSAFDNSQKDIFKKPLLPPKRGKANVPASQTKMEETVSASTSQSMAPADDKSLPEVVTSEDPAHDGERGVAVEEPCQPSEAEETVTEEREDNREPSPEKTQVIVPTPAPKARTYTVKKPKSDDTSSVPVCSQEQDVPNDQERTAADSTQPSGSGSCGSEPKMESGISEVPSFPTRSSRKRSSAPEILSETDSAQKERHENETLVLKPSKPQKRSSSSDPPLVDAAASFGRATRSKMRKVELEKQARTKSSERSTPSSESNKENPAAAILKDLLKGTTKPRTPMKTPNLLSPMARSVGFVSNAKPPSVKEQEAAKKKEELMKRKAEELRKQRELKTKKVHEMKAAAEVNRMQLEKEKKEKENKERELKAQLLREKEEKRNEKKLMLLQKAKEAEERRQREEQIRLAKLKEAEEEKKKAEEEKIRQMEEAERLAALRKAQAKEESARLLKEQQKKMAAREAAALNSTVTEDNIGIHENDQAEADDRSCPPRVARWAQSNDFELVLKMQTTQILAEDVLNYFGPVRPTPDLTAMFGSGLRYRPRTSSANWDPPIPKQREDLNQIPE